MSFTVVIPSEGLFEEPGSLKEAKPPLCGANSGPQHLPLPTCRSLPGPTTEYTWCSTFLPTAYAHSEEMADSLEGGAAESGQS